MPNPVVHFEILGVNGKGLQEFYSKLFDWKIDTNNPMDYGMIEPSNGGIGGGVGQTPNMVGHLTFYVQVDDVEAYLKKAESLGGRTMMPPTQIPGNNIKVALLSDSEGHLIGLTQAT